MKKLLAGSIIVLTLAFCCIYIFIPGSVDVSTTVTSYCNPESALRVLSDTGFWRKYPCRLTNVYYHRIALEKDGQISNVFIVPVAFTDSIKLNWECAISTGINPLTRLRRYREAKELEAQMRRTLLSVGGYLDSRVNVYGIEIRDDMSRDSTLIATKWSGKAYPDTKDIYERIHMLRAYAAGKGAHETDYPMMNVRRVSDDEYETMVALPVDKNLKGEGVIFQKMFVPYKILLGVVHGGVLSAEQGMTQLARFVSENQRTPMAMSFQSLVTERDQQSDTLKWVTHVIVPVNG